MERLMHTSATYAEQMDRAILSLYRKWPVVKPPEIVPQTMGERIQHRRKKLGMNTDMLGSICECEGFTIARWENAERVPTLAQVCRLADALETTPDYILGCPLESMYKHTGDRIKHMREEMSYSQEALAKIIGTSRQHLADLERGKGKWHPEELVRLADALEVTTGWLQGKE